MKYFAHTFQLGPTPFTVVTDGDSVIGAEFSRALPDYVSRSDVQFVDDLGAVSAAFQKYIDGDVNALSTVKVKPSGSDTMQKLWKELRKVKPGQTVSYAGLGGENRYARVAATACARNPIPLFIPCHRVVRSDGTLGGFAGGLRVKRWLLKHEGARVSG